MHHIDKIKEYYETGRYECDLFFYEQLGEIVKHLQLFEYCDVLQNNIIIIK